MFLLKYNIKMIVLKSFSYGLHIVGYINLLKIKGNIIKYRSYENFLIVDTPAKIWGESDKG